MSLGYLSTINRVWLFSLFQRHMQDEVVSLSGSASVRLKCIPRSHTGDGNRNPWLVLGAFFKSDAPPYRTAPSRVSCQALGV